MQRFLRTGLFVALFFVAGCSEPPVPLEVDSAALQDRALWRAGVTVYAPKEYEAYQKTLKENRELLVRERQRFIWFRDYKAVKAGFGNVILRGDNVLKTITERKQKEAQEVADNISILEGKVKSIRNLISTIKDGKIVNRRLSRAEVYIGEAKGLHRLGKEGDAKQRLKDVSFNINVIVRTIKPVMSRYADASQIAKWRSLVDNAVKESKINGNYSIVVSKLDRELFLYKDGAVIKRYEIGIGYDSLNDKLHQGDKATPEGAYKIIKKLTRSKYYKALLINYPNEEDLRRFSMAKGKNLLSRGARIGGLIEIHGGGKDGMTYGCISLDDRHIDELFRIVGVGTSVTIVGAMDFDNIIASSLKML